jgi:hypothetical protein
MAGAATRYGLNLHVEQVALRPVDAARLPTTAAQIIGADLAAHHVTAHRIGLVDIDDGLRLSLYVVDPLGAPPDPAATRLAADDTEGPDRPPGGESDLESVSGAGAAAVGTAVPAGTTPVLPGTRDGARREILAAIRAVLGRSGTTTFTPAQVVTEMTRRGTGYAESTIRTMVTAHMCRNAPDNAGTTYDDLERIDRGVYRLTSMD